MAAALRLMGAVTAAAVLAGCAASTSVPAPRAPAPRAALPPTTVGRMPPPPAPRATPAPRRSESAEPLTARIDARTPGDRATALRMSEQARGLLAAGETERAVTVLERAVALDGRLPYPYVLLADAHLRDGRPDLSGPFLDRAAPMLAGDPYWFAEVAYLRGRIQEDRGDVVAARADYQAAVEAWPEHAKAAAALARVGAGH